MLRSRNILIDCGKFFWASALKAFPKEKIDHLDAVILTHAHADAFFGLDDLRDFANIRDGGSALTVYVKDTDLPELARTFPYLMHKGKTMNNMHVPALSFESYPPSAPFSVLGLEFTPLPVHHGPGVLCSAFLFGNTVYMSDVNEITEDVSSLLLSRFSPFSTFVNDQSTTGKSTGSSESTTFTSSTSSTSPVDSNQPSLDGHLSAGYHPPASGLPSKPHMELLVLDALWPEVTYNSHFSLRDAIREFSRFRPSKGLCIGMSHEIEYHHYSKHLKTVSEELHLDIDLSYDGLVMTISLPSSFSSFWLSHLASFQPSLAPSNLPS